MIVRSLSISARLVTIALLSLTSVLFLGNLFVSQSLKDVDFARKELTGTSILAALLVD